MWVQQGIRVVALGVLLIGAVQVAAFCGFYVAKADTRLFNSASKVVLVRHDNKTVVTMAADYRGDLAEFALVVPVPTFLERDQIHVTDNAIVDHLDAYTAPRLVEYFDSDPCQQILYKESISMSAAPQFSDGAGAAAKALGVTIEAQYTVGEYDILLLSAEQSDGLQTWLTDNGYRLPQGAAQVLGSYIKQGTRFFVAKVNLAEQAKTGLSYLRPLQMAFESNRFMLPIRLGTVNADGQQELFVFALTRKGRVETTNYRTVKIPSDDTVPLFVAQRFGDFYQAMFERALARENGRAVMLEYAWDMNWCDPCAADPLSPEQLRELGVFWQDVPRKPLAQPNTGIIAPMPTRDVFVTRLHLRYDSTTFPEDLMFQETADRSNFQGRYVLRHPWEGEADCAAGKEYYAGLPQQFTEQAETLARLTGWPLAEIHQQMADSGQVASGPPPQRKWYQRLWQN